MIRILTKHLENERAWLRTESLGTMDRKYQEGARMAKERIPQLETAIKILTQPNVETLKRSNVKPLNPFQLNLFE